MKKLIPLLMLLVAMPTWAQRQFDIEVIIFKRVVDASNTNESWPNVLPAISYENTGSLSSQSYRSSKGVTLLPRDAYQLNTQEQLLNQHAGFKVLLHTAWRQGDNGKSSAPAFHLSAGKDFSTLYLPDGREITSSSHSPIDGVVEESIPKPLYELDGRLQVYVQHYLYVDATFDLKQPSIRHLSIQETPLDFSQNEDGYQHPDSAQTDTSQTDSTQTDGIQTGIPRLRDSNDANIQLGHLQSISSTVTEEKFLKSYRLEQKRRMRSGETIYFDHPLMGIIVQVRKVSDQ